MCAMKPTDSAHVHPQCAMSFIKDSAKRQRIVAIFAGRFVAKAPVKSANTYFLLQFLESVGRVVINISLVC